MDKWQRAKKCFELGRFKECRSILDGISANTEEEKLYLRSVEDMCILQESTASGVTEHLFARARQTAGLLDSALSGDLETVMAKVKVSFNCALLFVAAGSVDSAHDVLMKTLDVVALLFKPAARDGSSKITGIVKSTAGSDAFQEVVGVAWMMVGIQLIEEKVQDAFNLAEDLSQLDMSKSPKAVYLRGLAHVAVGKPIGDTLKLLCDKETEKDDALQYLKGCLFLSIGRCSEARDAFSSCFANSRYRASDSLNAAGYAMEIEGKHWAAMDHYKKAVAIGNDNKSGLRPITNMSAVYNSLGMYKPQVEMLQTAASIVSLLPSEQMKSGQKFIRPGAGADVSGDSPRFFSKMNIRRMCADAMLTKGMWETASDILRDVIAEIESFEEGLKEGLSQRDIMGIYYDYVCSLLHCGKGESAIEMCKSILRKNENDVLALLYLADGLISAESVGDALRWLNKADTVLSSHQPSLNSEHKGKKPRLDSTHVLGLERLTEGELDILKAYVSNNRGVLFVCLDKQSEAEECFSRAQSLSPESKDPQFNLCLLKWKQGKAQDAVTTWMKCRGYPLTKNLEHYKTLLSDIQAQNVPEQPTSHVCASVTDSQCRVLDIKTLSYFVEHFVDMRHNATSAQN